MNLQRDMSTGDAGEGIAVVGMSGRFPGAPDVESFWRNIEAGVEAIEDLDDQALRADGVPEIQLADPRYVRRAPLLDGSEYFDAAFFGFSAREAELLDPQHRVFLETAWSALEDAGHDSERFNGRIGVFAGTGVSGYLLEYLIAHGVSGYDPSALALLLHGNDKDFLAARVAYALNAKGPAITVQSACSTSLSAVHLACQSLLSGESDLCLAGGVSLRIRQHQGYLYTPGGIWSADGYCRPFDARASGTLFGSGVGVVVLKREEDAARDRNTVLAVIRGTAMNNDGREKVGFTAPGVSGQAQVVAEALAFAQVAPEQIGLIEAHGTATRLGDPIEIAALAEVYAADSRRQACAIGSVKSNVGHLNAAAGVAGLIKAIQALRHGVLPPSLHFNEANPEINFAGTPFYVNTERRKWPSTGAPRHAGVSSFGIGGTNVHVVLAEAAPVFQTSPASNAPALLTMSAASEAAAVRACEGLSEHLARADRADLLDTAYTLQVGRRAFPYRVAVVCSHISEAPASLGHATPVRAAETPPRVAFMFTGQGSQVPNMGRALYELSPPFREVVDRCCAVALKSGLDLRALLFPSDPVTAAHDARLRNTDAAQPALFALEYALARLFEHCGVQPAFLIGHSLGEYVAATVAGVFELEDALTLVCERGRLIQSLPPGTMLAVRATPDEIQSRIGEGADIAAINDPRSCVLSGEAEAISAVEGRLREAGIQCQRLATSHAFHSRMLEPALERFRDLVSRTARRPPRLRIISNLTGCELDAASACDPEYWVRHMRHTVLFGKGIATLSQETNLTFVEIGPGRTLAGLTLQNTRAHPVLAALPPGGDRSSDVAGVLTVLGELWKSGVAVLWEGWWEGTARRRVRLPTYSFDRTRYWLEPLAKQALAAPPAAARDYPRPKDIAADYRAPCNELQTQVAAIWSELLGVHPIGMDDNFFELGGHSLLATQVLSRVRETFGVEVDMSTLFKKPTVAILADGVHAALVLKIDAMTEEEVRCDLAVLEPLHTRQAAI
jgi:phthiocerol/phenolphthiocerol synthesis type-I polyketide synthase E